MWHWFGWWIFPALLLTFLIVRLVFFWRWRGAGWGGCGPWGYGPGWGYPPGSPPDADAILKRRLASGEITEDEYRRLKEALAR